ncbi:MAG: calcium-binding protein, partial [Lysobacteraceae bacterium]
DDILNGGFGSDIIDGGLGNDVMDGGGLLGILDPDVDTVSYASGNFINGVRVSLTLQGQVQNIGAAALHTLFGFENLIGTQYGDSLTGDSGANRIDGGNGADLLFGLGGNDVLEGGLGTDGIYGGDGTDTASYANAALAVSVNLGLQGQAQDTGGDGIDTLTEIENLTGSRFADTLTGDDGVNVILGNAGNDLITALNGNDTAAGGDGDDVIFGNQGNDTLSGDAGNDTLYGGQGDDTMSGGLGNDVLEGGRGTNFIYGDAGSDTASYFNGVYAVTVDLNLQSIAGSAAVAQNTGISTDYLFDIENLSGSMFDDTLIGNAGANVLSGAGGNDTLTGLFGSDTLFGDDGNDTLFGNQGNDDLHGGAGDDTLYGGQNDDVLFGDAGNDVIVGGLGTNMLFGGEGADSFVINAFGRDTIVDFNAAQGDRIDLRTIDANSTNGTFDAFSVSSGTSFSGRAGELIILTGVGPAGHQIQGDFNGDGFADFMIDVASAVPLNPDAFLFG